jgi:hypothetical protein
LGNRSRYAGVQDGDDRHLVPRHEQPQAPLVPERNRLAGSNCPLDFRELRRRGCIPRNHDELGTLFFQRNGDDIRADGKLTGATRTGKQALDSAIGSPHDFGADRVRVGNDCTLEDPGETALDGPRQAIG